MSELRNNIILFFSSLVFYFIALNTEEIGRSTIDSMFWPKLVLIVLMVLSFSSIIGAFMNLKKSGFKFGKSRKSKSLISEIKSDLLENGIKGYIAITTVFIYVFTIKYVGYFLSTLIFIPLIMYLFGEKRVIRLASTPLIFVFTIWVVFVQITLIMFPLGMSFFRNISQIIMFGF